MLAVIGSHYWPYPTSVLGWCPSCEFWTVGRAKGERRCRCGAKFTDRKDFAHA